MQIFLIMKSEWVSEENMSQRGSAVEDYEARMHDVENWVSRKDLETNHGIPTKPSLLPNDDLKVGLFD